MNGPDLSFDSQDPATALPRHLRPRHPPRRRSSTPSRPAPASSTSRSVRPPAAVDVSQLIAGIDWVVQHRTTTGMNIRVRQPVAGHRQRQARRPRPARQGRRRRLARRASSSSPPSGNDGRDDHRVADPASDPQRPRRRRRPTAPAASTRAVSTLADVLRRRQRSPQGRPAGARCPHRAACASPAATWTARTRQRAVTVACSAAAAPASPTAVVSGAVALLLQERPALHARPGQGAAPRAPPRRCRAAEPPRPRPARRRRGRAGPPSRPRCSGSCSTPAPAAWSRPRQRSVWSRTASPSPASATSSADPLRQRRLGAAGGRGAAWTADAGTATPGPAPAGPPTAAAGPAAPGPAHTWSGATWSGPPGPARTWSGGDLVRATWSGHTWCGHTWSGAAWSGHTWSGDSWA